MKNWLIALVFCIISIFTLVACGSGAKGDAENLSFTDYLERISKDSVRFSSGDIDIIVKAMKKENINPNLPILKMIKKNNNLEFLGMGEVNLIPQLELYGIKFKVLNQAKNNVYTLCFGTPVRGRMASFHGLLLASNNNIEEDPGYIMSFIASKIYGFSKLK